MLLFGEIKECTSMPFECYSSVALSVQKKWSLLLTNIDKHDQETQKIPSQRSRKRQSLGPCQKCFESQGPHYSIG